MVLFLGTSQAEVISQKTRTSTSDEYRRPESSWCAGSALNSVSKSLGQVNEAGAEDVHHHVGSPRALDRG